MDQTKGETFIGFVDDIAAVIAAKGEEILLNTVNRVLLNGEVDERK